MSLQPQMLPGFELRPHSAPRPRRTKTRHRLVLLLLLGAAVNTGCVNFHEKRAINAFQSGLEEKNVVALREKSTERFAAFALRHPEAGEALDQLKIPDGKFKILEVEDISQTEKKVTVGFGEDHRKKIQYHLVKDEREKSWKVDDIYLRQRSGDRTLAMAVTEQMDVLLSAREFYEAWMSGDRVQVLANSHGEMSEQLQQLPPAILAKYINQMIGSRDRASAFRPEAHISGDEAMVRLNRSHGTLVMAMENTDEGWRVKDLSLEGRGRDSRSQTVEIKSLTEYVRITNQAMQFLDAWEDNNKEQVKLVTQDRFFNTGLATASLSDVPLMNSLEVASNVETRLLSTHADVVVSDENRTIRIRLNKKTEHSEDYMVSDVAIYNTQENYNVSLSSALASRRVAEIFVESLRMRNQVMLHDGSTSDFKQKTWDRISSETLSLIPLPIQDFEQAEVVETQFSGEITHVSMNTEQDRLKVILLDQGGKVMVDDLLITPLTAAEKAEPRSLKNYLSAVAPVYELAANVHHNRPQSTLRLVTDDFYDRVFSLATSMPSASYTLLDYISAGSPQVKKVEEETAGKAGSGMTANLIQAKSRPKVERYQPEGNGYLVEFNTIQGTMQISLREEQGLLRVDDAVLVSPENEIVMRLKQNMRTELASGRSQTMIQTVSGEIRTLQDSEKRAKSVRTMQKTAAAPDNSSQSDSEFLDTTLQNALYEEYQGARPQLQQTGKSTPVDVTAEPMNLLTPAGSSRPAANPPAKLPLHDHLLLKPIPLE